MVKSVPRHYRRSTSDRIMNIVIYFTMAVVFIFCVYPFINIIAMSLSNGVNGYRSITVLPDGFTTQNYVSVFQNDDISSALWMSILRTVVGTVIQLTTTSLAAYALSKKQLPGRFGIIMFFYLPTIISGGLVPTYMVFRQLGMMNNFWVYIVPGLFGFYNMIILRTFFESIPSALQESAYIDGASPNQLFCRIVLPLSKAALATIALFIAVGHWNDWFTTMLYCRSQKNLWTLQYILQRIVKQASMAEEMAKAMNEAGLTAQAENVARLIKVTPRGVQYATLIISTVPIMVVYPFLQKYFTKGVMLGAIKS